MLVNHDNFDDALFAILDATSLTVDLETTSLDPYTGGEICGIAVEANNETFYFPFRHGDGENLDLRRMDALRAAFALPKTLLFWNGKFDLKFLLHEGFAFPTSIEDGMLAAHMYDENEHSYALKYLGRKYVDESASDESEELLEALKQAGYTKRGAKNVHVADKGQMWKLPASVVAPYAEQDVALTRQLRDFFAKELGNIGLFLLWQQVNMYELVVVDIERRGILLDKRRTQKSIHDSIDGMKESELSLAEVAGYPVNPNSPKQVCALFNITSSVIDVLEQLDHPGVRHIINYRRHSKMKGAYYKAFLDNADAHGVIRPNLNMTGTVTGRFSCSEPNLQAIPRGSEDAADPRNGIKNVFIARPGHLFVVMDYKQAEIYLGAHYASATNMINMIWSGVNVHRETANMVGIEYNAAKRLNFSMMYGIGSKALAGDLKVSQSQAQKYLTEYHKVHPEMKRLYNAAMKTADRDGYIEMFTGRRRRYDGIKSWSNTASSNLIQGGVAEMMRISATNIWRNLRGEGAHQLLHVHDSIIMEIPEDKRWLIDAAAEIMCQIPPLKAGDQWKVRFQVDVAIGNRWSEVESYKLMTQ